MNATLRNASTKSVILAPFNSSVSDDREFELVNRRQAPLVDKKALIKFQARCRDQDRQYEINNNCELDNGVYHKFVYSSHDGAEKPPQQDNKKASDEEEDFAAYKNEQSPAPQHKRPEGVEGALSTKMKQSTRNKEESFIQSFEQNASDNYEELERRIQSAKLEKRATHQLLPQEEEEIRRQVRPEKSIERNKPVDESETFSSNYSFVIGKREVITIKRATACKCLLTSDTLRSTSSSACKTTMPIIAPPATTCWVWTRTTDMTDERQSQTKH